MAISGHKEKLLQTTKIQDKVIRASTFLDKQTKKDLNEFSVEIRGYLSDDPKIGSSGLKTLTSEYLTYWNESINPDTEKFWAEMKKNKIDFVRKEPLRFALAKGRFHNVHEGMEARNNWKKLKQLAAIKNNYTKVEIGKLDQIIQEDERKRHEVLSRCLAKKAIPPSQYLKFGECMAYFANCNLFKAYFSKKEVDELYAIWQNF